MVCDIYIHNKLCLVAISKQLRLRGAKNATKSCVCMITYKHLEYLPILRGITFTLFSLCFTVQYIGGETKGEDSVEEFVFLLI